MSIYEELSRSMRSCAQFQYTVAEMELAAAVAASVLLLLAVELENKGSNMYRLYIYRPSNFQAVTFRVCCKRYESKISS